MATIELIPASAFTYEELTHAYNQTRLDYLVPMPMNSDKLREYVRNYDINMDASAVAIDGSEVLGLAMLGLRPNKRAWISRLGIIARKRRRGAGGLLVEYLINQARVNDAQEIVIEVIKGNEPALQMFTQLGFQHTRELLVVGRPPGKPNIERPRAYVDTLNDVETLELLDYRVSKPSWLDDRASLLKAGGMESFSATLADDSRGWLVYQNTPFQLGRIVLQTDYGDPLNVGRALLYQLHYRYTRKDTKTENLAADDPHWPIFQEMGYFEMFRRHEMILTLT